MTSLIRGRFAGRHFVDRAGMLHEVVFADHPAGNNNAFHGIVYAVKGWLINPRRNMNYSFDQDEFSTFTINRQNSRRIQRISASVPHWLVFLFSANGQGTPYQFHCYHHSWAGKNLIDFCFRRRFIQGIRDLSVAGTRRVVQYVSLGAPS